MARVYVILCVCLCLQFVYCQFGFYRPEERIRSPFGLARDFISGAHKIRNTFSNILHNRPQRPYDNSEYVPSQNRPGNDQYGQNYPNDRPNNVRFPNQGGQGQYDYTNQPNNPVFNDRPSTIPQQTGYGFENGANNNGQFTPNVPDGGNTYEVITVDGEENGQAFGQNNEGNRPNFGDGSLVSGTQNAPVFGQNNEGNRPNFGDGSLVSGTQNAPVFGQNNEGNRPNFGDGSLVSGNQNTPVFGQNNEGNRPNFGDGSLVSGEQNTPVFGQNNGENRPNFGNDATNAPFVSGEQNGPAFGQNNAVTNAPVFPNEDDIPDAQPPVLATTGLPVLSPVPNQESRNNFNVFDETCPTVDSGVGACLNIKECPQYVKLLEQSRSSPAATQILRKAHCGFDGSTPKVCCPRPEIPNVPPPNLPSEVPTPAPAPVTAAPDVASGKSLTSDFVSAFPVPPECGVSNASFSRVVGGVDAKLGDFPWMALLGYQGRRSPTTSWLCGGSLITKHHVLTAAHCIHNHEEDLYIVRVGELDLAKEDEGATPVDVLVKDKIKHENYNSKSFTNDIGLLVLQKDVQFTDLIRPICIPTDNKIRSTNFEDYMPFIAGWGDLEFRGPKATHLQVLQLPVVSNDFCRQAYAAYKAQVIDERVMCAGYKKGGKDSCQGDSGGPLMQPIYNFENATTYFYQIGVVSFGKKCAEAGFPGVYTRVTSFVPWLEQNVLGIS